MSNIVVPVASVFSLLGFSYLFVYWLRYLEAQNPFRGTLRLQALMVASIVMVIMWVAFILYVTGKKVSQRAVYWLFVVVGGIISLSPVFLLLPVNVEPGSWLNSIMRLVVHFVLVNVSSSFFYLTATLIMVVGIERLLRGRG